MALPDQFEVTFSAWENYAKSANAVAQGNLYLCHLLPGFAEAGPEAIMPLRRGADGNLGVRAELPRMPAMQQAAMPEINVNIQGVQGQPEVSARRNPNGGIDLDIIVKQVENRIGANVAAGQGGMAKGLESRYVLTKRLG